MTTLLTYPNYTLSKDGVVVNKITKTIKKAWLGNNGYLHVDLYHNGKSTKVSIHRLLAMTYIPNPHNKRTVNHIDGNKLNNSLSNLEWATDSENVQHAYNTGLNLADKLFTDSELLTIFEEFKQGDSFTTLAAKYKSSVSTITTNLRFLLKSLNMEYMLDNHIRIHKKESAKIAGLTKRATINLKMINISTYKVIKTFNSITEATEYLNKKSSGPISNALSKVANSGYGYYWVSDDIEKMDYSDVANTWAVKKPSSSKSWYKGINLRKDTNKYRVTFKGSTLGNFNTEVDALNCWNTHMLELNLLSEVQQII